MNSNGKGTGKGTGKGLGKTKGFKAGGGGGKDVINNFLPPDAARSLKFLYDTRVQR